ncbi:MAG TPA: molecular chaperone HtpG [Clostridiales bacterium]|nr:molecular chaperone HtpG [Clostridiales bacterium]HPV02615.1 molecular chaperone HtpG [Clostridiales bacterium]
MPRETGNLSIHTENILPIIKKWLYSDKDIFVREMVSNANDAITKMKKLASIGEAQLGENEKFTITVDINKDTRTIKFIDNGIGMTDEEVKKYINQVAFSGAVDFIEKYKDKADEGNQIIGHFGLGFYSAFMVSDKVTIDTLSWQPGASAVRWVSTGGTEYEMDDSDRTERGTTVTLYLSDDSLEFLDYYKMRSTLDKYCYFMPYEIYLRDSSQKSESAKKSETDADSSDADLKSGGKADDQKEKPINDTNPLWLKPPKDCTEEEYKEFYRKVFHDFNDPLFWIHLNMDYPFNLKGILYFPKLRHEFDTMEGQIKLYYNQVFVADNIKEVIPEFLMLLRGVIDCPDLPLNVSRSFLQNDGYVNKISTHITRKVADKLTSLYENDRENYNRYWDDINPFVKFGCMREEKFFDRVKDIIIFRTINGDYTTLKDYLERNRDKHKDKVFYVSDEKQQAQYIKLFREQGMEAVILNALIDNHFIQFLEMKESGVKFLRIDSDLSDNLKDSEAGEASSEMKQKLETIFRESLGDDKLKISVEALKASTPAMILLSEYPRRMQEMTRMYGMPGMDAGSMFPDERTLVLNRNNALIKALVRLSDDSNKKDDVELICRHVFDLAMLSHKQLEPEAMMAFIERSNKLLEKLAELEEKQSE